MTVEYGGGRRLSLWHPYSRFLLKMVRSCHSFDTSWYGSLQHIKICSLFGKQLGKAYLDRFQLNKPHMALSPQVCPRCIQGARIGCALAYSLQCCYHNLEEIVDGSKHIPGYSKWSWKFHKTMNSSFQHKTWNEDKEGVFHAVSWKIWTERNCRTY